MRFLTTRSLPSLPVLGLAAILGFIGVAKLRADEASAFPTPRNTEPSSAKLSTPEEALRSIRLPEGFRATLFAAEPDVQQPIAIATDERGRLWVAENYTYAEAQVNFDKNQRDRIVILEDTDGDGRHDKRTVFWDQANKLTSIEIGFGGVWALCAPNLLFIPDRNRDDVPDGPPVVVLDGWDEAAVRHNIVNGLRWGPDGWLYGRHGILATSVVGKPGSSESQRGRINCGVWRYHPTREVFEPVAHGTTNPWGFDFDDHGQMFFINTVIGHLWHLVPGAHYRRMYGADFNPYLYQLLEQTADHFHWDTGEAWHEIRKGISDTTARAGGGHAHSGLMFYLGGNWPDEYRNNVFTINLHGRRLNNDHVERHGAAYTAEHGQDLCFIGDQWFRGIDLIYGPDGGVFIADWTDVGECHENDGVHRSSGRIFKIIYGKKNPAPARDLAKLPDAVLVDLQLEKNDWHVRQARRLLQERAQAGIDLSSAKTRLLQLFEKQADVTRQLRALWCLWAIGAADESFLLAQLQHPEEHVRTWAVRLLSDGGDLSEKTRLAFTSLATKESSGLVQVFLASALQRLPHEQRWPLAMALAKRSEFATDGTLPLMIWYGIEPAVPLAPERAVSLAATTSMPTVRKHIARRLTSDYAKQGPAVAKLVESLAQHDDAYRLDLLNGMSDALRGWRKAEKPSDWDKVAAAIAKSSHPEVAARVRDLSVVFGDGRAADELVKIATDGSADVENRRQAVRTLVESQVEGTLALLQKLVGDRELGGEAVRGLAAFDAPQTPQMVLDVFPRLDPESKVAAINTLVSRPAYARVLLESLAAGRIARRDVSAYHARQIQSFGDDGLTAQLAKVWGETRATDAEKRRTIGEYKTRFSDERIAKANHPVGRLVFQKTCANCHVLYGQGKAVGPDLTGSNRKNLDYLLENLLDPSAQVAADFRMSVIVLESGRVVTGVIVEQAERTITLQLEKERITIDKSEIEEQKATTESLMPEGLLKNLGEDQVRDLLGYLMGTEQVPLAEEPAETKPAGD